MNIIMELKSKLGKLVNKEKHYAYRAIVSETLPVYHDRFRSTNKNTISIDETDDRFHKVDLESQENIPVKFHREFNNNSNKNFAKHTGNKEFEMHGMKQGLIIKISGGGFLENENDIYEAVLITNEYVYLRNLRYNTIYPKSYEEIKRIKDYNALEIQLTN